MSQHGPPPGPPPWGGPAPGGPPPVQTSSRRPGTRAIRVGIILMILSVVGGVALTVLAFLPLFGDGAPMVIRGSQQVQAEAGETFALYRLPGVDAAANCEVAGPDGQDVPLRPDLTPSTLSVNGQTYHTEAVFDAPRAGAYTVTCPGEGERFAVGSRVSVLRTVLLGFGGIFGGIGLFLAGMITLIIGVVLRSSASRRQWGGPYQGGPPFQGGPPYQGGPP